MSEKVGDDTGDLDREPEQPRGVFREYLEGAIGADGFDRALLAENDPSRWKIIPSEAGECSLEQLFAYPSFRAVVGDIDSLVCDLDMQDSLFFQNKSVRREFSYRLCKFADFIERKIQHLQDAIKTTSLYGNFPEGWKEKMRKFSYYAFFIHFGSFRNRQTDQTTGHKIDYAYHPVNTAFDALIRMCRFNCAALAGVACLHDIKEDWGSGLVHLLNFSFPSVVDMPYEKIFRDAPRGVTDPDLKKREVIDRHFSAWFETADVPFALKDEYGCPVSTSVKMIDLLGIVTKSTRNRSRALLDILSKVCSYDDENDMFLAALAIILKICDRLDNMVTYDISSDRDKYDETIYFLLAFSISQGMWNVTDWLNDLILVTRYPNVPDDEAPQTLGDWLSTPNFLDQDPDNLMRNFETKFANQLLEKWREAGHDEELIAGRDFVLTFRKRGLRYSRVSNGGASFIDDGASLNFWNYVLFHANGNDKLAKIAVDVFKDIFNASSAHDFFECATPLGDCLSSHRGDVPMSQHNSSFDFGYGYWAVFSGPEDISESISGNLHRGYFFHDQKAIDCRKKVCKLLRGLKPFSDFIQGQYALLDEVSSDGGIDKIVQNVSSSVSGSGHDDGYCRRVEEVLGHLVMTTFMAKDKEVNVLVNGESTVMNVPDDVEDEDLLVYVAPLALGREFKFNAGPPISFDVDMTKPFDVKLMDSQVKPLTDKLARYREDLTIDRTASASAVYSGE